LANVVNKVFGCRTPGTDGRDVAVNGYLARSFAHVGVDHSHERPTDVEIARPDPYQHYPPLLNIE
jgi:hypothetical protein